MHSRFNRIIVLVQALIIATLMTSISAQSQTRKEAELETLLLKSQQYALDLEKNFELLKIHCDSTEEAFKVMLNFEHESNKVKLDAANDKLELRRVFTDTIRAVEKEKYNEMKTFLMKKAQRRWYESPYLWLVVGFIGGVIVDR